MSLQVYPLDHEELSDCSGSTASSGLQESRGQSDIADFLPSSVEWLAFVKCIAEDNAADLKEASKHLNWTAFLQSWDVTGAWSTCSNQFRHKFAIDDASHPYPTNPFFVALFYNARKCLAFMHESGVDFSKVTEHGFTAYHMLLSAIRFMSDEQGGAELSEDSKNLVSLFHYHLFTREQQQQMLNSVCGFGMTPMSWGVYLGLANHVELIMRYYAPDTVVHSDAVGLNERVSLDVSEYVGQNPSFFTSPICVLLDLYSQDKLHEVKALGIFRSDSMWKQWVDALYSRNYIFTRLFLLNTFMMAIGTAVLSGAGVNDYLRNRCSSSESTFPYGLVVILFVWFCFGVSGSCSVVFGLLRKEKHRKAAGYPKKPRENLLDVVTWNLPCTLAFPVSAFLIWLYMDIDRSCAIFGRQIFAASGVCIILLLLSFIVLTISYSRLVEPFSTLMSSLYSSMIAFTLFMALYFGLTAVFTRMFQSSFVFSKANNSTTTRPDDATEFFKAFYQVFLVSLNILDSTVYVPESDRIDLLITHVFYVMMVPILFINFVIGILSSIVSRVQDYSDENRYMMMLTVAELTETSFFFMHALLDKIFGQKPICIQFCEPLKKHSRLLTFHDASFASVLSECNL